MHLGKSTTDAVVEAGDTQLAFARSSKKSPFSAHLCPANVLDWVYQTLSWPINTCHECNGECNIASTINRVSSGPNSLMACFRLGGACRACIENGYRGALA